MGSQQLFCLRWSNHQTNMLSVFDQLLQNEALVDVTLACEGLSLRAHKVVLSACSPYFQALFMQNPCKHPIVILKDIKYTDLRALVDFMYKGEVNVTQEQLSALLKTAETLKVKGLAEMTGGGGVSSSNSLSTLPASMGSNRLSMVGSPRTPPPPPNTVLPPNVPPLSMGVPVSSASPIPPHPALQQIPPTQHQHHRSLSPPSSKRRKMRTPHRSSREPTPLSSDAQACEGTATHSDCNDDDGDSLDLQGSPEVLETKVEVPSEAFGPERSADQDSHPDPLPELQMDLTSSEAHDDSAVAYQNSGPNASNTNLSLSHSAPTTPPTSLLPPPPPPSSLPPSLPSTSGTQPASQGKLGRFDAPSVDEDSCSNEQPQPFPRNSNSALLDAINMIKFQRFVPPHVPLTCALPSATASAVRLDPVSPSGSGGGSGSESGSGGSRGTPKRGQPRILNEDEEGFIVRYILEMAARGKPVTRKCVLEYGNMLLRRHDRVPTGSIHCNPEKGLSNDWWKEFKKRHPGLPFRAPVNQSGSDYHPGSSDFHPGGSDFHPNASDFHPNTSVDFLPGSTEFHSSNLNFFSSGLSFHPSSSDAPRPNSTDARTSSSEVRPNNNAADARPSLLDARRSILEARSSNSDARPSSSEARSTSSESRPSSSNVRPSSSSVARSGSDGDHPSSLDVHSSSSHVHSGP